MSDIRHQRTELLLQFYQGEDMPGQGIFYTRPVDPEFTDELEIAVYSDDDSIGVPESLQTLPLQVQMAGTPRALEAFGIYLIALARLETADPDPHEHFDDVRSPHGGMHLIVRRM